MRNKKSRKIGYRQVFMIMFTLFWVIYPYIARVLVKKIPSPEDVFFANTKGLIIDLVLFCKEVALAVFAGGCILYFLGERIFPDRPDKLDKDRFLRLKLPFIFIGGYIFFSVLSFLFCDYKETAFFGVNSEYEGLLAVLSYAAVFVLALYYLKPQKDGTKGIHLTEIFKYGVIAVSVITGVLGIIEIFVRPILEFPFMQDLISSEENRTIARSIRNENFIGQISLTFHNPGFLGGFCALITPVCLSLSMEGKKIRGIICSVATGLLLMTLWWSNSTVALVAVILTVPAFAIMALVRSEKNKRQRVYINVGIAVATGVLMIVLTNVLPTYSSRYKETHETAESKTSVKLITTEPLNKELLTALTNVSGKDTPAENISNKYKLTKAELIDGALYLYSGETLLKISVDKVFYDLQIVSGEGRDFAQSLVFSDGKERIKGDKMIPATLPATSIRGEKQGFGFDDDRYRAVKIALEDRLMYIDLGYSGSVEFYLMEDGLRLIGQGSAFLEEIPQPRVTGFESLYSFGTGRGYLWVQSLPLLWESMLIGGGNGTFAFRFRQNEIVGLLNTHGSCKYVIDRPHNWYLQIALSDGVTALICVLALFVWYIITFFKSLGAGKKEKSTGNSLNQADVFDIGLFFGLVGFMLCGMINDSCVTVNPWFWLLFGCAVTRLIPNTLIQDGKKKAASRSR